MASATGNESTDRSVLNLKTQNLRQTLDELQSRASGVLSLTIQWRDIQSHLDSWKNSMEARFKELRALEEYTDKRLKELQREEEQMLKVEAKEKEFRKLEASLQKEREVVSEYKQKLEELELKQKNIDERSKELELREKQLEEKNGLLELKGKDLPNARTLEGKAESSANSVPNNVRSGIYMDGKDLQIYLNEHWSNNPGEMEKKLAFVFEFSAEECSKIILDAMEGFYPPHLKKDNETFDGRVAKRSCNFLLEQLIRAKPKISLDVKEKATQLASDWYARVKTNADGLEALGFLLLLAAYGLECFYDNTDLLDIAEPASLLERAPALFKALGWFTDKISSLVDALIRKEEFFPAIRFICEFDLFEKFHPSPITFRYLCCSKEAVARCKTTQEKRKLKQKRKDDLIHAIGYIEKKKLFSWFPYKHLKDTVATLRKQLEDQGTTQSVDPSNEKLQGPEIYTSVVSVTSSASASASASVAVTQVPKIQPSELSHQVLTGDVMRSLLERHKDSCKAQSEVADALKLASNPAKLILDTVMVLSPQNLEGNFNFKLRVTPDSCLLLFEQLKMISPHIQPSVKDEAKKLSDAWMLKLLENRSIYTEVLCFLHFVVIYKLVSDFKADELLGLLDDDDWHKLPRDLCQSLPLVDEAPRYVDNLIMSGQHFKALKYIYMLDVMEKFPPVPLLSEFLKSSKENAESAYRRAKNIPAAQAASLSKHVTALRDALKCVSRCKLEAQIPPNTLLEQIGQLERQKAELGLPPKASESKNISGVGPQTPCSLPDAPEETSNKPRDSTHAADHPNISGSVAMSSTCLTRVSPSERSRGRKRPWENSAPASFDCLSSDAPWDSHAISYCNSRDNTVARANTGPPRHNNLLRRASHANYYRGSRSDVVPYYSTDSIWNHNPYERHYRRATQFPDQDYHYPVARQLANGRSLLHHEGYSYHPHYNPSFRHI